MKDDKMKLKEVHITKNDINSVIPELMDEVTAIQKLKKSSSKIQFGQIQKLMWESQQADLLDAVGFVEEAKLIREFFGCFSSKDHLGGVGSFPAIASYAGLMLPHVMGEKVKNVDQIICEIFEKKTVDIDWYNV